MSRSQTNTTYNVTTPEVFVRDCYNPKIIHCQLQEMIIKTIISQSLEFFDETITCQITKPLQAKQKNFTYRKSFWDSVSNFELFTTFGSL